MATPLTLREIPGPGVLEAWGVLAAVVAMELTTSWFFAGRLTPLAALWVTGAVRTVEIFVGLAYWELRGWTLEDLGLRGGRALRGLRAGLAVSAVFGGAVLLAEAGVRLTWGRSWLAHVLGQPARGSELAAYVAVGGVIAPLFEEFLFRGVLYRGLRSRVGPVIATILVTVTFALAHSIATPVPWIQAVGGVLFCAAYEIARSLWAPVLIHAAGNTALFLLPLLH